MVRHEGGTASRHFAMANAATGGGASHGRKMCGSPTHHVPHARMRHTAQNLVFARSPQTDTRNASSPQRNIRRRPLCKSAPHASNDRRGRRPTREAVAGTRPYLLVQTTYRGEFDSWSPKPRPRAPHTMAPPRELTRAHALDAPYAPNFWPSAPQKMPSGKRSMLPLRYSARWLAL